MTSPGRADLGGIENETLDFSHLEEFINDESGANNLYFTDSLVSSESAKEDIYGRQSFHLGNESKIEVANAHLAPDQLHGCLSLSPLIKPSSFRFRNGSIGSSFCKPHLPDSPPDSGSEPPFSPSNEDLKMSCTVTSSLNMLHQQVHHIPHRLAESPETKSYLQSAHHLQPLKHVHEMSLTQTTASSPSPNTMQHTHHHQISHCHQNTPVSAASALGLQASLLSEPPLLARGLLSSSIMNSLPTHQQPMITASGNHLDHLYTGVDDILYESLSSPAATAHYKKRKLSDSSKLPHTSINDVVHVKTEPLLSSSPEQQDEGLLTAADDDYSLDLSRADGGSPFVDSNYQCIRFQPFHQHTWLQLLDKDMNEIASPHFRVDADKGFNYSNADESFVCQKKNHFQVTIHLQHSSAARAQYVRTLTDGIRPIEKFALQFHGVKMESQTQTIKVEQSQSDRSKKPFRPVPVDLLNEQVSKTTVGRLHFSETTSNNMRKKGKPNPDQRFFFLVVSLCAHVAGEPDAYYPICAHSSEKIIVRASNPGQFENDMELSWQKGNTQDSIFHTGRVGINTDRPEESLVVHGNIKVTGHIVQPSDVRAKIDVQELDTKEQLKNVANLRIVSYRYQPEFAAYVGVSEAVDTGVIAQEVQEILPEAVMEAGDIQLPDGQLIDNLLVVNKERIFMENVGAVKELCKVTDNLENRIDELERMNKKLTSIKRMDSIKSNATQISGVGSVTSRGRCSSSKAKAKCNVSNSLNGWSTGFVQYIILALIIVMALCLVAFATLYILEFQYRHLLPSYLPSSAILSVKSPIATNATELRPNTTFSYNYLDSTTASIHNIYSTTNKRKISPVQTESSESGGVPGLVPTDSGLVFGQPHDECSTCPVFCCPLQTEHEDYDTPPTSEDETILNYKKRSDESFPPNIQKDEMMDFAKSRNDGAGESSLQDTAKANKQGSVSSDKRSHNTFIKDENPIKIRKRMVDYSESFVPDAEKDDSMDILPSMIHIVEFNTSLSLDLCQEEKSSENSLQQFKCLIYLSRYFPHPNITLRLKTDVSVRSDFCGGSDFISCSETTSSGDAHQEEKTWILPAGSYIESRYRFRLTPTVLFPPEQQLCTIEDNQHSIVEYIIKFQRRCDK